MDQFGAENMSFKYVKFNWSKRETTEFLTIIMTFNDTSIDDHNSVNIEVLFVSWRGLLLVWGFSIFNGLIFLDSQMHSEKNCSCT